MPWAPQVHAVTTERESLRRLVSERMLAMAPTEAGQGPVPSPSGRVPSSGLPGAGLSGETSKPDPYKRYVRVRR